MLQILQARRAREEEGFTLIELMVVVLIIAILIAIAIPTFLGARSRAQDKNSQSNVRNGVTAAKTIFTDANAYTQDGTAQPASAPADLAAFVTELTAVEPAINFVDDTTTSSDPKTVSVDVADDDNGVVGFDTVYMVSKSKSGKCWAAQDIQSAANAGTGYAEVPDGTDCNAGAVEAAGLTYADEF